MVGVVVEDAHAVGGADQLEAPPHALETAKSVEHGIGRRADVDRRQQCAERIERHVPARHREPHHPRVRFPLQLDVRDRAGALLLPVQKGACQRLRGSLP